MSFRRITGAAATGALLLTLVSPTATAQEAGTDAEVEVSRHVVESFDGTPIVANLFVPPGVSEEEPAELVLETHGWGGTGRTSPGGLTAELVDDGYVVLTWDQRGFGCSGGLAHINDPDAEGRDVSALIDVATERTAIRTEPGPGEDGDPVVGMVGGSYAGGIQTAAAAVDPRIDAIAPDMSWSDLAYSLYPGEVVKQGWVAALYGLGTATAESESLDPDCDAGPQPDAGLHPTIHRGVTEVATTGTVSDDVLDFFDAASLAHYGGQRPVTVPTLVTQSAVDTLFNLTDGVGIHEHVRAQGVDSRLLVYCGGHVNCPTSYEDGDDTAHLRAAVHDWFAVHLRDEERNLGAPVEYRTNEGEWRSLDALPTATGDALTVAGAAKDLVVAPVLDVPDLATLMAERESSGGSLQATPLTAAAVSRDGDPRAATFEVARAEGGPVELVGIPEVELTVDGTLLETLDELPADTLEDVLAELHLEGLEPVTDQAGETVGAAPVAGNVAAGALAGLAGVRGDETVPTDVHVFVKLVHRESGEVVNLQEGAARIPVADGPTTVPLTMPGLAYTLPQGDHLDLQLSTASLMHATGRLPALVDASVEAAIPVADADGGDTGRVPGDGSDHPPAERPGPPADRPGPATAAGAPDHAERPEHTGSRSDAAGGTADGTGTGDTGTLRAAGAATGRGGHAGAGLGIALGVLVAAGATRARHRGRAQRARS